MSFFVMPQIERLDLQSGLYANDELSANVEPLLSSEMIRLLNAEHLPKRVAGFDEALLDEYEWAMLK